MKIISTQEPIVYNLQNTHVTTLDTHYERNTCQGTPYHRLWALTLLGKKPRKLFFQNFEQMRECRTQILKKQGFEWSQLDQYQTIKVIREPSTDDESTRTLVRHVLTGKLYVIKSILLSLNQILINRTKLEFSILLQLQNSKASGTIKAIKPTDIFEENYVLYTVFKHKLGDNLKDTILKLGRINLNEQDVK